MRRIFIFHKFELNYTFVTQKGLPKFASEIRIKKRHCKGVIKEKFRKFAA